ncbi:MAG: UDPglucose--hexose-phosphate uridylyltransferase [Chthoniobacter sp.]|jgi:UDPglucose--hexose-1-phosphate uridylyltransferase|nr:UDPglucose--hexose-phosphate uridylyltransferase [Chthoniobacter sp.]
MNETEMRLDPLRQTWTVFSEARLTKSPFAGARRSERGFSPFAAGHEQFTPPAISPQNGDGWKVRVVPNRAPALRVEGDTQRRAEGFYDRMDGVGAHEVIIENPGPEPLEELSLPAIGNVITMWKNRMVDLLRDARLRAFFIVKDVGEPAGAQVSHALSQLIAMSVVPAPLLQKLDVAREFYERKKRSIFEDVLREEVRIGTRLVYENNGFAAFCPYASRAPFEVAIYPKRQCADFHGLSDQEIAQLADALKATLRKLARALDRPAYHLMLFTAPTRTARRDHWNTLDADFRWHIEIVPCLFYTSGFELGTGCCLNTVWPETAAEYLRKIEI